VVKTDSGGRGLFAVRRMYRQIATAQPELHEQRREDENQHHGQNGDVA
jgi:hypothetical protein